MRNAGINQKQKLKGAGTKYIHSICNVIRFDWGIDLERRNLRKVSPRIGIVSNGVSKVPRISYSQDTISSNLSYDHGDRAT